MNTAINRTMGPLEWAMLLFLSVLWGCSFFFVEIAVKALPPLTIVTLRVLLAASALWCILFAMGIRPPRSWSVWSTLAIMGCVNNVIPFTLIVWGQTHIQSGLASILNATMPLWTVLLAGLMLADEKLSLSKISGIVIGFIGVVIMIGPDLLVGIGDSVLGQLAIVMATFCYGLASVYGRRLKSMGVNPIMATTGQLTMASVILLPIVLWVDQPFNLSNPSMGIWGAVIGLALFSTALAYIIYFRILSTSGAGNISLVTFLIPVSAILLGSVFLDESLQMIHFIGMAFIGLGLSFIDGRIWKIKK